MTMYDFNYLSGMAPYDDGEFVRIGFRSYPKWANGSEIRSREDNPYSYSFYVAKGPIKVFENADGAYDDRMRQWSREDWDAAWAAMDGKKHFSQMTLSDLSKFLSTYYKRKMKCLQLLEGCNVYNGYPVYYFVWEKTEKGSADE